MNWKSCLRAFIKKKRVTIVRSAWSTVKLISANENISSTTKKQIRDEAGSINVGKYQGKSLHYSLLRQKCVNAAIGHHLTTSPSSRSQETHSNTTPDVLCRLQWPVSGVSKEFYSTTNIRVAITIFLPPCVILPDTFTWLLQGKLTSSAAEFPSVSPLPASRLKAKPLCWQWKLSDKRLYPRQQLGGVTFFPDTRPQSVGASPPSLCQHSAVCFAFPLPTVGCLWHALGHCPLCDVPETPNSLRCS